MKKLLAIITSIMSLTIVGCSTPAASETENENDPPIINPNDNDTDDNDNENENNEDNTGDDNTNTNIEVEEDPSDISITLDKTEIELKIGKNAYLVVYFPEGYQYDPEGGTWSTSDSAIATVNQYGKVTGVSSGEAYIHYTDSNGVKSGKCLVYVYENEANITREWIKVTDVDSIKNGDQLIFACPEFGVAASLNRKDGYLKHASASFTTDGNKITSFDSDVATFFVGESVEGSFTLENQNGEYLSGKSTTKGNSLQFVKSKGQINWIFERPIGYSNDYCVNYDIVDDYWLMFNKVSNNDIRFNLYDSNPTQLMKLPTFYRLTRAK